MLTYLPPKVKEKIIRKLLFSLGVGSGGLVESSGEDMVIKLLKTLPYFSSKDNLCVFDVGANVGKYLTSCVSILNKIQLTPPRRILRILTLL